MADSTEEVEKEKEKEGKKLYKGEVKKAGELEITKPTPVQPVSRAFRRMGFDSKVPPTFILTRFSKAAHGGHRMMHYYDPKSALNTMIDVPNDFELNVLSGKRKEDLDLDWEAVVTGQLHRVTQRIGCTVGSDPEIFVVNKDGVVPAWTFLGSKKKPDKWQYPGYDGTMYWDGFQAEFTTGGAITCLIELTKELRGGLLGIHSRKPKGSTLSGQSVVPIDPEVLRKAKDEHVEFGCAPSKNAYGLKGSTQEGRTTPYRFAGGHIHLGLNPEDKEKVVEIVKALDAVVGVACVSLFAGIDSPIRRQYYGLAGEYRTPAHGLEYRTLSNAWLSHPVLVHMVYDLTRATAGLISSGHDIHTLWPVKEEETVRVIQENDVDGARKILVENLRTFKQIMYVAGASYSSPTGEEVAWDTWTKGVGHLLADPGNVERNWLLNDTTYTWDTTAIRTFNSAASVRRSRGKI